MLLENTASYYSEKTGCITENIKNTLPCILKMR